MSEGYMYLLNPENGNLVNANTGKDIENITWDDLVQDTKKIVIAINGGIIYSPAAENAIIPFQKWVHDNHPEIELSLHSGKIDYNHFDAMCDIILEACAYGLFVSMAQVGSFKVGKMAKYSLDDDASSMLTTPAGTTKTMSEEEKQKLCSDITTSVDLLKLKPGSSLLSQYPNAGISPGRFYMMGSHTEASKSKLVTPSEFATIIRRGVTANDRAIRIFLHYSNPLDVAGNKTGAEVMGEMITIIAGTKWVGVANIADADVGFIYRDGNWVIEKVRGCMDDVIGCVLFPKERVHELAKEVNVKDAYPQTSPDAFSAKGFEEPPEKRVNTYDVDWGWAVSGILIIVDVQHDMSEPDTELNREMLGRCTDAIFTNNLEQYVMIKGDTDNDYETRLERAISNVSCVINISGGEGEIEKFDGHPELVNTKLW